MHTPDADGAYAGEKFMFTTFTHIRLEYGVSISWGHVMFPSGKKSNVWEQILAFILIQEHTTNILSTMGETRA